MTDWNPRCPGGCPMAVTHYVVVRRDSGLFETFARCRQHAGVNEGHWKVWRDPRDGAHRLYVVASEDVRDFIAAMEVIES